MKRNTIKLFKHVALVVISQLIISCKPAANKAHRAVNEDTTSVQPVFKNKLVMTKAEQDSLMSDEVVQEFKAGNERFKNDSFVKVVAQNNIRNTMAQISAKSEILRTMECKGEIKIVGAFYTLRTGELQFVN